MTDQDFADRLVRARRGAGLAAIQALADTAQAYRIQALTMALLGDVGGWKVGAPGPDGPIGCAPLAAETIFAAPCDLDPDIFTQREVESEICFVLAADLPAREAAYGPEEILTAIGSARPGVEILQSRYADPASASPLAHLADCIQSGGYAVGQPIASWQGIDFASVGVTQSIEGGPTRRAVGNPAGDMMRLLLWLADHGAVWAGGLRAGQVLTCGSWTGKTGAPAGSTVTAAFDCAQPVSIRFRKS